MSRWIHLLSLGKGDFVIAVEWTCRDFAWWSILTGVREPDWRVIYDSEILFDAKGTADRVGDEIHWI
jgi:hypothetical protein